MLVYTVHYWYCSSYPVKSVNIMDDGMGQVLTYAQQSRERANYEQAALADRMQEYRRQMERENQRSFSDVDTLATGDGIQAVGRSSHKLIEAVMQSTPRGKVGSHYFQMNCWFSFENLLKANIFSQIINHNVLWDYLFCADTNNKAGLLTETFIKLARWLET